ncbi:MULTISPECIES: TetR/AcrR family transcriptional regulator [unclassified Enterococcus]|uniref:TetR/AcrR family transcriptional regulator n=1 Tax=unclassified Enterococcus TaxID=2608891 RepID=UPI0013ECBBC8|nr:MULTISPECIES: TetR/AcrR family transcriptional regulator [unclassified Enterococcus]
MGRRKEFDTQEVLKKAMDVFWQKGYEQTSMQDLVDAMAIHRRSIYDTFGDKHRLFIRSLKFYEEMIEKNIAEKMSEEMEIIEKLRILFSLLSVESDHKAGCLVVNSAAELSNVDPVAAEEIRSLLEHEEQQIFHLLLSAQEKKELSADTNIEALSYYLHNALVGIRVLSKTTDDNKKLNDIIEQTLLAVK